MKLLITAIVYCFATQGVLAEPVSRIQAIYEVSGFGMTLAIVNETYTRTDDNYQIESVTKAVGLLARFKPETIRVTSSGKITKSGLLPLAYVLTRKTDTDKNASAKFNWDKAQLTHTDYKGVNQLPLEKGTQDRLSVLYHLPLLAKTGQSEFNFSLTDGNNLESYNFKLSAEEQNIELEMGSFKTRFIGSTPAGEQVKYEIWMATERDYFPYKVIVTDAKGGKLTQVLTKITITP